MAEPVPGAERDNPEVSHETADINVRGIVRFGIAMLAAAVVIHLALYWLLIYYNQREASRWAPFPFMERAEEPSPEPRLRVAPRADLTEMRNAETELLHTYGWIDRDRKIVRMPIEQSMEMIAKKGLPVRKQTEKNQKK